MLLLLGKSGRLEEAAAALEETIKLKPDYYDAYNELEMLYHQLAINQTTSDASASANGTIVNPKWQKKAVETYRRYLTSPYYEELVR